MYEKSPDVGRRLSGDFQGIENWSSEKDVLDTLKETGLELDFPCVPYYSGTVYAPGMAPVEVKSARPIFYLVKRGSMAGTLDAALKEQALALGAELIFNRRVGDFEGRAIVGTGPARANVVAVGITFDTTADDLAAVAFGDDLAPGGYAYLLVNRGCGTLATVLYLHYRRGNECFERTKRFFAEGSGLAIRNEKRFGSFGDFFISGPRTEGGKLHVGEAAGFQDFLWGFGLRYAMVSGGLAARSVIEGTDYDALWKRQFRPMLETSLVNRYLFEKLGKAGYRYLTKKFAGGDPCGYLRRHYNGPFFKRLLLPVAKRGCRKRLTGRRRAASGASEPIIEEKS